jgi:hypothetical protein
VTVLTDFGWKIEHFIRLKFNLWFDDTMLFTLNKYVKNIKLVSVSFLYGIRFYLQKSEDIDYIADSLWSAVDTSNYIARWLSTNNVRYIFLPLHFASGHYALALLDCRKKKCLYLDSADGGK